MFVSKLSALNHRRVRVRTHHTFRVIQNRHFRGARYFFLGGIEDRTTTKDGIEVG